MWSIKVDLYFESFFISLLMAPAISEETKNDEFMYLTDGAIISDFYARFIFSEAFIKSETSRSL